MYSGLCLPETQRGAAVQALGPQVLHQVVRVVDEELRRAGVAGAVDRGVDLVLEQRRGRPRTPGPLSTCSQCTMPAVPSMSDEMKTLIVLPPGIVPGEVTGGPVHAAALERRVELAADLLGARAARIEAAAGRQVDGARRIADDGVAQPSRARAPGAARRAAAPACTDGARPRTARRSGAVSTMRPRYITATRSQTWRTTAMLWATKSIVSPSRCAQVGEQVEHGRLHRDVERRHGLVGDQDLGLERERARDRDALALAARELARVGVERARRQPDEVEQLAAARVDAGARHELVHAQQLGERLAHGHARVERRVRVLEDHLQAPPVGARFRLAGSACPRRAPRRSVGS